MKNARKKHGVSLQPEVKLHFKNYILAEGTFDIERYQQDFDKQPQLTKEFLQATLDLIEAKLDEIKDNGGYYTPAYNLLVDQHAEIRWQLNNIVTDEALEKLDVALAPLKISVEQLKEEIKKTQNVNQALSLLDSILKIIGAIVTVAAL